ncbi:MAG: hypothetical protein VCC02_06510, partial [Myxococcota bacterium]
MSEEDSGRKRFMGDIMRRISPSGTRFDEDTTPTFERPARDEPREDVSRPGEDEPLQDAMSFFGTDSTEFRRRLDRMLSDFEALRRRYQRARDQIHDGERQNEKLVHHLQESKQQIELLKE